MSVFEEKVIQDEGEEPLVLRSSVPGKIDELSVLRRALLFAELAMIAYNDEDEARRAAEAIGFPTTILFARDGAEAYQFESDHDCVIACRGTEPNQWNDIKADANAFTDLAETVGRVHRGFKKEVDDLWPMLEKVLADNTKPLWFCGHSLGGAMATICASRCKLSTIDSNPAEVQTFGSPRVGNKRYVNYVKLEYYRWVHNNDIVARVPPSWLGYRHAGNEMYLDSQKVHRPLTGWERWTDRLRGLFAGFGKGKVDYFSDHSITEYIAGIMAAVENDERQKGLTAAMDGELDKVDTKED